MKTLQRRMILAVFFSTLLVFLIAFCFIKINLNFYYRQQASSMVELIKENDGVIPDQEEYNKKSEKINKKYFYDLDFDDESPYRTRYFFIHLTENGTISNADYEHIAEVNQDTAEKLIKKVLNSSDRSGYIDNYYYSYVKDFSSDNGNTEIDKGDTDPSEGEAIIFLNCRREQVFQKMVLIFTGLILVGLCIIVTFIFAMISNNIMKPFEENSKRQKQFITDASHELKTPLSIIAANADVLRYKEGENVWLENITSQTIQMNKLIGDLLSLTKADEMQEEFIKEQIDIIPLIRETWTSFQQTAEAKNVTLNNEIPESFQIHGNKEMLERLFSVLIENAVKYVSENGNISLTMKTSKKNATIIIYNSASMEDNFNYDQLFDRFYRMDQSRNSSTGGHGIGLSIAKKIVDMHRGKITAYGEKDGIAFKIILPR